MKQIPEFPNYSITKGGRVWSHRSKKWLRPTPQTSGHLSVMLTKNKQHYRQRVHRLVLEVYVGPCPEGMVCRHLNSNPADNRFENLEWNTQSKNIQDSVQQNTHFSPSRGQYGENACNSKLSNWDRNVILFDYLTGEFSQAALGRRYGLTDVTINHLVHGKTWPFVDIHSLLKRVSYA